MTFLEIKKEEERLERFQHNYDKLKEIADEMWPYLEEIFYFGVFFFGFL